MAAKKSTARTAATKKASPAKGAATTTKDGTRTAKKATTKSTSSVAKKPAKNSTSNNAAKTATKTTTAKSTTARKASTKAPAKKATATRQAVQLVVREDESPWTPAELKEVRVELEGEIARLRADLQSSESELTVFLREPIDGAGDDQADAGAKSFEREHELSLLAGARAGLEQNLHALERLEDGTYGICESCGNPIGKLRLQAYPRATLCLTCKSTQERR